jgi:hypothetical protein
MECLIIGFIIGTVLYFVFGVDKKRKPDAIGKPEFKYNSWFGYVMIRKGSSDEMFYKALAVAYILMFLFILWFIPVAVFVIILAVLNSVLPLDVAIPISLILFVTIFCRVIYISWKGMTTFYCDEQVDSFSECSCSQSSSSESYFDVSFTTRQ